jgi:hypothetical protein
MLEDTVKRLAKAEGKKYGGKLKHWSIHKAYGDITFVMGIMTGGDPSHRFEDGWTVRTSSVVWLEADFDYVETTNTFYILEGEKEEHPLPDAIAARVFF